MTMYAEGTVVPVEKSRSEIERLVRQHGAVKVGTFTDADRSVVTFATTDRMVKFSIAMPQAQDPDMVKRAKHGRYSCTPGELRRVCDAEERRRWRALLLVIKAKFEGIESRIESFDEAFLSHIVTPGGATIMEEVLMIQKSNGQPLLGPAVAP